MRVSRLGILICALLSALLAGCEYEVEPDWHPMVDEVQGMPMCGPETPLNAFEKTWFCDFLVGIGEQELPWGAPENPHTYRLLFLPSFETSLVLRVDVLPWGEGMLTLRGADEDHSKGNFNYLPPFTHTAPLTRAETTAFLDAVNSAALWTMPVAADTISNPEEEFRQARSGISVDCLDGKIIVYEAAREGAYHVSRGACEPFPALEKLARYTLNLARAKVPMPRVRRLEVPEGT